MIAPVDRARAERLSLFLLSLPERAVRSLTAVSAGLLREAGDVALPPGLRRTRLYTTMVETTLRFLIERVGQVEGTYPADGQVIDHFLLKRTVGDGIDLAGLAVFGASPVWVLAALADLTGAGRQFMNEIAGCLKAEGLLAADRTFANVDQILDGLEHTTGQLATSLRYPPLDVRSLRKDWLDLKEAVLRIPPRNLPSPDLLRERWDELKLEAAVQGRSTFELSSLIALATIRRVPMNVLKLSRSTVAATVRTAEMFAGGLLEHYRTILREIHETGYGEYWSREFRPYLHAAARQFSIAHPSLTERLLNRARVDSSKA